MNAKNAEPTKTTDEAMPTEHKILVKKASASSLPDQQSPQQSADEAATAPTLQHKSLQLSTKNQSPPSDAPAAPTDEKPAATSDTDGAAAVVAVAEQVPGHRKAKEELSEEEKARQTAVKRLIESRQYTLPIGVTKRRRHVHVLLALLLLLLLGIAAFGLALDTGLIETSLPPPTDFFEDQP